MKMYEVDVIMPTWNSGGPLFKPVIKSIKLALGRTLHHFILIDRFSSDDTVKIVKETLGDNLVVIESNLDLAMARKIGLNLADTDVVLMVDSDVIITPAFYHYASKLILLPKIGAVGASLCSNLSVNLLKIGRIIMPVELVRPAWLVKYSLSQLVRGYLFAVMIKRDLLNDWKPPAYLSAYEDYHMSQHIIHKGYIWIELASPCVMHLKDYKVRRRRFLKQGLWEGANAKLSLPTNLALYDFLMRILFGVGKRDFSRRVGNLIGFFNYYKYRVWQR